MKTNYAYKIIFFLIAWQPWWLFGQSGNFGLSKDPYKGELSKKISGKQKKLYVGAGVGLDYANYGLRVEYRFIRHVGITAAVGYNLIAPTWQIGATVKALPLSRLCPVFTLLYGTNAAIEVSNKSNTRNYTGISFTTGLQYHFGKSRSHNLYCGITLPFVSNQFLKDRYALIGTYPNLKEYDVAGFSIGFNYGIW